MLSNVRCFYSSHQFRKMFFSLQFVLLTVAFVDSSTSNVEDCMRSNGVKYRGKTQTSSAGLNCLVWTNATRDYDVTSHMDSDTGVGDHNYCRNPDSSKRPWCYIMGPDGMGQRQSCSIKTCKEQLSTIAAEVGSLSPATATAKTQRFESAPGKVAAVQPVMGISQRVRTGSNKKKDLGTLGYVFGILMIAVIILLGAGITLGYFFKRAQDLKKKHEQHVYEREMQRINLPLSAFSNPTCELVDENTIVITADSEPTLNQDRGEGEDPLMGHQAVTPGA